jgi:hypothetical protein
MPSTGRIQTSNFNVPVSSFLPLKYTVHSQCYYVTMSDVSNHVLLRSFVEPSLQTAPERIAAYVSTGRTGKQ